MDGADAYASFAPHSQPLTMTSEKGIYRINSVIGSFHSQKTGRGVNSQQALFFLPKKLRIEESKLRLA